MPPDTPSYDELDTNVTSFDFDEAEIEAEIAELEAAGFTIPVQELRFNEDTWRVEAAFSDEAIERGEAKIDEVVAKIQRGEPLTPDENHVRVMLAALQMRGTSSSEDLIKAIPERFREVSFQLTNLCAERPAEFQYPQDGALRALATIDLEAARESNIRPDDVKELQLLRYIGTKYIEGEDPNVTLATALKGHPEEKKMGHHIETIVQKLANAFLEAQPPGSGVSLTQIPSEHYKAAVRGEDGVLDATKTLQNMKIRLGTTPRPNQLPPLISLIFTRNDETNSKLLLKVLSDQDLRRMALVYAVEAAPGENNQHLFIGLKKDRELWTGAAGQDHLGTSNIQAEDLTYLVSVLEEMEIPQSKIQAAILRGTPDTPEIRPVVIDAKEMKARASLCQAALKNIGVLEEESGVTIASPALRSALKTYPKKPQPRALKIVFPFSLNNRAAFTQATQSRDITDLPSKHVSMFARCETVPSARFETAIEQQLAAINTSLALVANPVDLGEPLIDDIPRNQTLDCFLKDLGTLFALLRGLHANYNCEGMGVGFHDEDNRPLKSPQFPNVTVFIDERKMFASILQGCCEAAGQSYSTLSFSPDEIQQIFEKLITDWESAPPTSPPSWGSTRESPTPEGFQSFVDLILPSMMERSMELLEKPDPSVAVPFANFNDLNTFASKHKALRRVPKQAEIEDEENELKRLISSCKNNASVGDVKGDVVGISKFTKRCPQIKRCHITRENPDPVNIVYVGNIACQGFFEIEVKGQLTRLDWKMDPQGEITAVIDDQERDKNWFSQPKNQNAGLLNLYREMRHVVLGGLDQHLVKKERKIKKTIERSTDPTKPTVTIPGKKGSLKLRARPLQLFHADRSQSTPNPDEPSSLEEIAQQVFEIIAKIRAGGNVETEEIENLRIYIQDTVTEGGVRHSIPIPMEPLPILIAVAKGDLDKEDVFFSDPDEQRSTVRGGYSGHTHKMVPSIRVCEQNSRSEDSKTRLRLTEQALGIKLLKKVAGKTTVTMNPSDPNRPDSGIEAIVLSTQKHVEAALQSEELDDVASMSIEEIEEWMLESIKEALQSGRLSDAAFISVEEMEEWLRSQARDEEPVDNPNIHPDALEKILEISTCAVHNYLDDGSIAHPIRRRIRQVVLKAPQKPQFREFELTSLQGAEELLA